MVNKPVEEWQITPAMVAIYVEKKKNIQPNLEQNSYRLVQNSQQDIDRDCATYTTRWKFCSKVDENKKVRISKAEYILDGVRTGRP